MKALTMKDAKNPTIYEISRIADVSIATVSRALNAHTRDKVAVKTRQHIDNIVKQYGYTPNLAARNLGSTQYHTVGVVMAHFKGVFSSAFHTQVLSGVADALMDTDYGFKLIMLKTDTDEWDNYNFRSGEGVDGLIMTHWGCFFSGNQAFEKMGIPCVGVGDYEAGVKAHFICSDNAQGGALVAEHLYHLGHRHIAVLSGSQYSSDSKLRIKGFKQWMRANGSDYTVHEIYGGEKEFDADLAAEKILQIQKEVTAVFAVADFMAIEVMQALSKKGWICPRDYSLIGYDNDPIGKEITPTLSTVQTPVYAQAHTAVNKLIKVLSGEEKGFYGKQTVLPVELVPRDSTCQLIS